MEKVPENKPLGFLAGSFGNYAGLIAGLLGVAFVGFWNGPDVLRLKAQIPLQIVFWSAPVLMVMLLFGFPKLEPWLKSKSMPLPFLKPWVRMLMACLIFGLASASVQELLNWQGFPVSQQDYKIFSKLEIGLAALWGWLAFGVFYEVSGYFAAKPKLQEPFVSQLPPPPPPVPREEWWKKYY